jgi:hypothetical protein
MKKKKGKSTPAANSADLAARVRQLLGKGSTREAVELAKELLRTQPGGESEAILADAYAARVEALARSGLAKEAGSLAGLVAARYPALRMRFSGLAQRMDLEGGDLDFLLERIARSEASARPGLERELTPWLFDPSTIATSPRLQENDPLRVAAGTIAELFRAVTSGPVPSEAMSVLDTIPRQSPLASWKLLIRAIEAFHRGDNARVKANLDAIPSQAPAARVRPVVERLMSPESVGSGGKLSPQAEALRLAVGGEREEVAGALRGLEATFRQQRPRDAVQALRRIVGAFRGSPSHRLAIATLFRAGFRHGLTPSELVRALGSGSSDLELLRLAALAFEEVDPVGAAVLWNRFLEDSLQQRSIAHGWEAATVLLHVAEILPDSGDDEDLFGDFFDDDFDEIEEAKESLGGKAGLLERALEESRDPRIYRALVRDDPERARHWVLRWREEHPREIEPLLHLLEIEEREKHYTAALALAEEGVTLDPSSVELRSRTLRLLLRAAEEAIGGKAFERARDLLARLDAERAQFGESAVWLDALKVAAAGEKNERYALLERLPDIVGNPTLAAILANALRARFKTLIPLQASTPEPAGALSAIIRVFTLRERWGVEIPLPDGLVIPAAGGIAAAGTGDLALLGRGAIKIGERDFAWTATTEGLAREEATAAQFLWLRGELLLGTGEKQRALLCLQASRELARAVREMDMVRGITETIQRLGRHRDRHSDESFDVAQAHRVLRSERAMRATPHSIPKRHPRKKKARDQNRELF